MKMAWRLNCQCGELAEHACEWPCEPTCDRAAASAHGWDPFDPSYTQRPPPELFSDLEE